MTQGGKLSGRSGALVGAVVAAVVAAVTLFFLVPEVQTETEQQTGAQQTGAQPPVPAQPTAAQPTGAQTPATGPGTQDSGTTLNEAATDSGQTPATSRSAAPQTTPTPGQSAAATPAPSATAPAEAQGAENAGQPQAAPPGGVGAGASAAGSAEAPGQSAGAPVSGQPQSGTETPPPPLAVPGFDVVRVRPDGGTLVAGRAAPGAEVSVLVDGTEVARTTADAGANFVAMFDLPPSSQARVMTLREQTADGTAKSSETSVIVEGVAAPVQMAEAAPQTPAPATPPATASPQAPAAPAATATAGAAGSPSTPSVPELAPESGAKAAPTPSAASTPAAPAVQSATGTAPAAGASAPSTLSTPSTPTTPPAPPAAGPAPAPVPAPPAPRVLLAGPDGVEVLQDPRPQAQLSVDAISYSETGEVALAGRGKGDGTLRIYLDNEPVGVARVGADGQWRAPLPDVAAGIYTLRVDRLSPEGKVTSRVETPFKREAPEALAAAGEKAAAALAEGRVLTAVTVQPGNTLWAIAERRYGRGIAYWKIFNANRDQIRDPHWIYPGQIFTLPGEQ